MKKNKKKGFTLVELLAVIVVLAIILVIAVPKILDVIKSSRENSLISSVKLIARNAEQKRLANEVLGEDEDFGCSEAADLSENDYQSCTIDFDEEGNAIVTIKGKGKFSGYTCSGTKNNVTCTGGSSTNNDWDTNALTVEEALDMGLVWYSIDANSVAIGVEDCYTPVYTPNSHKEFTVLEIPTSIGGKKVTSIGGGAFTNGNLTSVTIPNSITSIGTGAFAGCDNLTSVTIPNSVTSIGDSVFYNTPWFENLEYDENGLIIIGSVLYDVDYGVTSVTIPNSVTSIGYGAFLFNENLESATIPNSVTSIDDAAFCGCENLTNVTIPNSVKSIGERAFYDTPWLNSLEYDENGLIIIGNVLYDVDENITGSVTIPNGVTSIAASAFDECTNLTSVTIPNSITSIGDSAFSGCTSLEIITIPDSVTSIGWYAFDETPWIENQYNEDGLIIIGNILYDVDSSVINVTIPSSVTSIEYAAFEDCDNLESVTIPNSVTSIGGYAFEGCTSLENVIFNGNNFRTYNNLFTDTPWFENNQIDGYILGENYLIRDVEYSESFGEE